MGQSSCMVIDGVVYGRNCPLVDWTVRNSGFCNSEVLLYYIGFEQGQCPCCCKRTGASAPMVPPPIWFIYIPRFYSNLEHKTFFVQYYNIILKLYNYYSEGKLCNMNIHCVVASNSLAVTNLEDAVSFATNPKRTVFLESVCSRNEVHSRKVERPSFSIRFLGEMYIYIYLRSVWAVAGTKWI